VCHPEIFRSAICVNGLTGYECAKEEENAMILHISSVGVAIDKDTRLVLIEQDDLPITYGSLTDFGDAAGPRFLVIFTDGNY
jgi:hypothetical protein